MPGVFSVPERRPPSWPPPTCWGWSFTPFLTTSAPTPFGPWSLWPERVYRSAHFMSKGTRRKPCTPSTWISARPFTVSCSRFASSSAPVSLFTCMQLTSDAPSESARSSSSQFSCPAASTPITRTSWPCSASASKAARTEGCSTALTATTCRPAHARHRAQDRQVVGLGAAGGEDGLAALAVHGGQDASRTSRTRRNTSTAGL